MEDSEHADEMLVRIEFWVTVQKLSDKSLPLSEKMARP